MYRWAAEVKAALRRLGGRVDEGNWIEPGQLLACPYPHTDADFAALEAKQVRCLINLHPKPHDPARLAAHGLTEHHFPTPDYEPPAPPVLEEAVAIIRQEIQAGHVVAIHCGVGLGRTGTLVACYLLYISAQPDAGQAIAYVRERRPGAIETPAQEQAVTDFAQRRHV